MKYTNKEYIDALNEVRDFIDELQTADQIIYQSDLDNTFSDCLNEIADEIERIENVASK